MEGSWEGIARCIVHVDVHGVCAIEHGRHSLSCMQKL